MSTQSSLGGQPHTASYKLLYSFTSGNDGEWPLSDLIEVNGDLYGTTVYGGGTPGVGTIFKVSTSGMEQVLHQFRGSDGQEPVAGLVDVNGVLYGTASLGGARHGGTAFQLTTSGSTKVIYNFQKLFRAGDGRDPESSLTSVGGTLYGSTRQGGSCCCLPRAGCGTVFSLSTSGVERVLYRFQGGTDGSVSGHLIDVNGRLYGATKYGGKGCYGHGCGTIFSMSTSGAEHVLHRFTGGADGAYPNSGLIDVKGTLYGTTSGGVGAGTVFSVTTSGRLRTIYSFKGAGEGSKDGSSPMAGLTVVHGVLYGTTEYGGDACLHGGCGTIFSVSKSGRERVLYNFQGDENGKGDGAYPLAHLRDVNGTLFGTTYQGGTHNVGAVFSLTP